MKEVSYTEPPHQRMRGDLRELGRSDCSKHTLAQTWDRSSLLCLITPPQSLGAHNKHYFTRSWAAIVAQAEEQGQMPTQSVSMGEESRLQREAGTAILQFYTAK